MKIKFIFISLCFLLGIGCNKTYGQSTWELEANFSQGMNIDKIKPHKDLSLLPNEPDYSVKTAQVFGLELHKFISPKVFIGSGLTFCRFGYSIKDVNLDDKIGHTLTMNQKASLNYLQLPISLGINKRINEKLSLQTSLGLYVSLLVDYKMEVWSENFVREIQNNKNNCWYLNSFFPNDWYRSSLNKAPFKIFNWGPIFQIGLKYQLYKKFSIPLSITGQYGLREIQNQTTDINYDSGISESFWNTIPFNTNNHPLYLGLRTGIIYQIN
jgi:hypothetical protein